MCCFPNIGALLKVPHAPHDFLIEATAIGAFGSKSAAESRQSRVLANAVDGISTVFQGLMDEPHSDLSTGLNLAL